jgi:hypothetical protein
MKAYAAKHLSFTLRGPDDSRIQSAGEADSQQQPHTLAQRPRFMAPVGMLELITPNCW